MEPSSDPAGVPEKPVDPGISQIPVSVNKPDTSPPPFAPASQPEPPAPAPNPQPSAQPMPNASPPPSAPQVVTPAGVPSLPPTPGTQPTVTVGGGGLPPVSDKVFLAKPPKDSTPRRIKVPKKFIAPIAALLVIVIGSAAFYFGYYQNPSVIYSQSLSNTGKGYMSLIDYMDKQSKLDNKGYTGSGTYNIKSSGYTTDGQFGYKSNNKDTEFTFSLGASVTRINADVRALKSMGSSPDVYIKLDGIKGLGTTLGDAALDRPLSRLDGQWIVIDHTLIENLQPASAQSSSSKSATPTHDQIMDEARAFGNVNQQYVFTTDKDKAVTKVVKKYGTEEVGGHKTYHYQVALQPANVKKYILAQRDALLSSKLDGWIKQNHYETSVSDSFNTAASSTKSIKSSDTFDIWMDTSHRVIYKVRVSDHPNPAENYVDIGLDYKGGDDYPFFFSGQSKDGGNATNFSLTTDLNTKTHGIGFKFNDRISGSSSMTLGSTFNLKPNATAPTIAKPANAIQLSQALSELGLDGLVSDSGGGSSSSSSSSAAGLSNKLTSGGTRSAGLTIKNMLLSGVIGR